MNVSRKEAIDEMKTDLKKILDCADEREMREYVWCKLDINKNECSKKITQPALLWSYNHEFKLLTINPKTLLLAECIMIWGKSNDLINVKL